MYAENGKSNNRKNVICRCAFLIPILMDLCFFIQVTVIRSGAFPKLPTWLKLILEMRGIKRYYIALSLKSQRIALAPRQ